jgi:hypothetical protein
MNQQLFVRRNVVMRTNAKRTSLSAVLVCSSMLLAGVPNQNMSVASLGVEYCGLMRGQLITTQHVPAHERIQEIYFHYAPVEYAMISAGLGVDRLSVDQYGDVDFQGDYGFAPAARLSLFTPRILKKMFSITAGGDFLYLNSQDDRGDGDYRYGGPVVEPFVGLKISAGNVVDIEAGARGHFLFGTMENNKTGQSLRFSNSESFRGYLGVTLYSVAEGGYLNFYFDTSPEVTMDWSKGPSESTIGLSLGVIIHPAATSQQVLKDRDEAYFPSYDAMKKKQDEMAKDVK